MYRAGTLYHALLAIKITAQTTYGVCPNMSTYMDPTQSVPGVREFLYAFVTNLCKVAVWCRGCENRNDPSAICRPPRVNLQSSSGSRVEMCVLAPVSHSGGKHVYTCTVVRETLQWYMNVEFTLLLVSVTYSTADWMSWFACSINVCSGYKLFGICCRSVNTDFTLIRS